ncbi:MAG TPA: DUF885 domain-containing protein [Candidatus Xenobia bacterium]|jgi:prolyl oligopeptidase
MNQALGALAREYWDWMLKTNPTMATYLGDRRYDDLLPDISAAGLAAQDHDLARFEQQVTGLTLQDEADKLTAELLRLKLRDQRAEIRHGFHEWVLDQLAGPQVWLLELLNYQPLKNDEDLERLTRRYQAFQPYMQGWVANLRDGVKQGRVLPAVILERVLGQLHDLLNTPPNDSPLHPRNQEGPRFSRTALAACEKAVTEQVYPAYRSLRDFLEDDYPARDTVGLSALPGGAEAYQYRIHAHTTTPLTAAQVHELGIGQVAALEKEMAEVARSVAGTTDIQKFRRSLQDDSEHFYANREDLLDDYRAILTQVEAMLPRWFGRLPASRCDLKPIESFREKDCIAAFYYPPSEDFSRAGVFYVNTYEPGTRPRYHAPALTVHEAVPGHHLQIALAMEQSDLPDFRRHGDFTAYVEGWALYTERLANEMGVYRDALSRFGMLTFQVWRAARLVVDTGLHAMGWSREQAIQYFEDHVGLPSMEIVNEIDRYIMWPGQALAYAVGMNEFLALRRLAEDRLGSRFDIKAFHDEVLRHGALPLSVLRHLVEQYVERRRLVHS